MTSPALLNIVGGPFAVAARGGGLLGELNSGCGGGVLRRELVQEWELRRGGVACR